MLQVLPYPFFHYVHKYVKAGFMPLSLFTAISQGRMMSRCYDLGPQLIYNMSYPNE